MMWQVLFFLNNEPAMSAQGGIVPIVIHVAPKPRPVVKAFQAGTSSVVFVQPKAENRRAVAKVSTKAISTSSGRRRTARTARIESRKAKTTKLIEQVISPTLDPTPKTPPQPKDLIVTFKLESEAAGSKPNFPTSLAWKAEQRTDKGEMEKSGEVQVEPDGTCTIKGLQAFGGVLTVFPPDDREDVDSEWEAVDADSWVIPTTFDLKAKNSTIKRLAVSPLKLRRNRADFEIAGLPADAIVEFGEDQIQGVKKGDTWKLTLDIDALKSGAGFTIASKSPVPKQASIGISGNIDPYQPNRFALKPDDWDLTGAPTISVLLHSDLLEEAKAAKSKLGAAEKAQWPLTPAIFPKAEDFALQGMRGSVTQTGAEVIEKGGAVFQTRSILLKGKLAKIVERIDLVDTAAGSVGGIRVGDPADRVSEVLGRPDRSDKGVLTYLKGLLFTTEGGKVSRISIAAPAAILGEGFEASHGSRPRTLFCGTSGSLGDVRNQGTQVPALSLLGIIEMASGKKSVEDQLKLTDTIFQDYLRGLKGFEPASQDSADLQIAWNWRDLSFSTDDSATRASITGYLTAKLRGEEVAETVASEPLMAVGEWKKDPFGIGKDPYAESLRKAREILSQKLTASINENLGFNVQVEEIGPKGQVILAGGENLGIAEGDEFDLLNFGEPAVEPASIEPYLKSKSPGRDKFAATVLRVVKVLGNHAYCVFSPLLRVTGLVDMGDAEHLPKNLSYDQDAASIALSKFIVAPETQGAYARFRIRHGTPKNQ